MKRIEIDLIECHQILLSIAKEFDGICQRHQIPYYMLGGTMLGAVRHKGFIPWDDDMDFGVPRKYYTKLIDILQKELPKPYRIHTVENSEAIISNFFKIDDSRTVIEEYWREGETNFGINIDIFPLDEGCKNPIKFKFLSSYIFFLLRLKDILFFKASYRKGINSIFAKIIQKMLPLNISKLLRYIDRLTIRNATESSPYYINYYGHWGAKEIISKEIFGAATKYKFEEIELSGVQDPNSYLTHLYNDYTKIPPLEQQEPHAHYRYYR